MGGILVDSNTRRATSGEQRHGANRPDEHVAKPDAHRREGNGPIQRTARDGPERINSLQSFDFQQMILIPHRLSLPSQESIICAAIDAAYELQKYRCNLSNP